MKQKAIIALLWGSQHPALKQFLEMHEPVVVITHPGQMSPALQTMVAETGGSLMSTSNLSTQTSAAPGTTEVSDLDARFTDYLARKTRDGLPEHLAAIIANQIRKELPETLGLLDSLQEAAKRFDICLLVTSEDVTRVGKITTAWARAHGIPSLHLAHAIALANPYTVHDQLIADKLAVYGKRGMEGYQDLGIPQDRMHVTGNPAWDSYRELRNQKPACRRQLDEKYKLKPHLPLVVFGTTWAGNLSAHTDEHIYTDTLTVFFCACETLRQQGLEFNAVIKDRPANQALGMQRCSEILGQLETTGEGYAYTTGDTQTFAAAADVLVAVDSNYLVEGMLARTPVINLINTTGMLLGPCFEAESGMLEVEAHQLAEGIQLVLTDQTARSELLAMAGRRAAYYNHGDCDGKSATRVAQLMAEMTLPLSRRETRFVWQQYLDVASTDITAAYHTVGRADLAAMYTNRPALILDVGCAAGSTAALIKQRFPGSSAWGIEVNRAAAQIAETKLDRVLIGKFEDFNLEQEGIAKGSLDAVLLADVLEHMYNPWEVMVTLRPYMSPTGQLLLSIPNVRNLLLMDQLSKGNWTYEGQGLLDITHIRFFTFREILRFCEETGYRVINTQHAIDGRLKALWQQHQALPGTINIDLDRITLKSLTQDDLRELCTIQFYFLLEKKQDQ